MVYGLLVALDGTALGFLGADAQGPRIRQIWVWPNLAPYNRSTKLPTRLRVQVP